MNLKKRVNAIIHFALRTASKTSLKDFNNDMGNIKKYQQKNLLQLIENLKDLPAHKNKFANIKNDQDLYQCFRDLPVTSYRDYDKLIQEQRSLRNSNFCKKIVRYQPTSGSTNKIKWIPYNRLLLNQFDQAASVWMADLQQQFPSINKGTHYWSLSWLPSNMRKMQNIDDSEILSPMRRFFVQKIFAVPKEVMFAQTIEDNFFATACFLIAAEDLTFISIWSPTFMLSLLEFINKERSKIISVLENGVWPQGFKIPIAAPKNLIQAKKLRLNFSFEKIWDQLSLISCWDTAQSKIYAKKLQAIFTQTNFQGKGLWATEAVITLPIGKEYPLSYQSHFYEFQELSTERIYPSWQLKKAMVVSPIISTVNGLVRYKLNDRLLVTGHIKECPCFKFLGRIGDSDLVGEKLSHELVEQLFTKISSLCSPICLIGIQNPHKKTHPYYLLLAEKCAQSAPPNTKHSIEQTIEQILTENFHYKLARDLNQLGAAVFYSMQNAHQLYEKLSINKGMIKGNIKVDPLISIQSDEFRYEKQ